MVELIGIVLEVKFFKLIWKLLHYCLYLSLIFFLNWFSELEMTESKWKYVFHLFLNNMHTKGGIVRCYLHLCKTHVFISQAMEAIERLSTEIAYFICLTLYAQSWSIACSTQSLDCLHETDKLQMLTLIHPKYTTEVMLNRMHFFFNSKSVLTFLGPNQTYSRRSSRSPILDWSPGDFSRASNWL